MRKILYTTPFFESWYPLYILRLPAAADFKTPVPFFRAAPHGGGSVREMVQEKADSFAELRLIVFDSQHIVSAFSDYGRRRSLLRVESAGSHNRPLQRCPQKS